MGSLVLRPGDSLTILKMALSVSFIRLVLAPSKQVVTQHNPDVVPSIYSSARTELD